MNFEEYNIIKKLTPSEAEVKIALTLSYMDKALDFAELDNSWKNEVISFSKLLKIINGGQEFQNCYFYKGLLREILIHYIIN